MQICTWQTINESLQLTEQGKQSKTLYYIVSGGATVRKSGKELEVGDNLLLAKFLFRKMCPPPRPSMRMKAVSHFLAQQKTEAAFEAKSLKAGFDALLSNDLAEKLANDEARGASDD